jgi:hypothetical protein
MREEDMHPMRVRNTPPVVSGSIHRELEKVKFPQVMGFHGWFSHRILVGEYGNVFCIAQLYLQHEGLYGGFSTERECASLVEDTLTTTEYGH